MKERKYKESYILQTQFDPVTGKEKRVPVYKGDYYCLADPYRDKRSFYPLWILLACFALAGWLGYLFAGSPSSSCLYVLPAAAMEIFPLFYLGAGLVHTAGITDPMDIVRKEKGIGRVYHSFWGCLWLSGLSVLADGIFMILRRCFSEEALGVALLLVSFGSSLTGMRMSQRVYHTLQRIERLRES